MVSIAFGGKIQKISEFVLVLYPWASIICCIVIVAKFCTEILNDLIGIDLYSNRTE